MVHKWKLQQYQPSNHIACIYEYITIDWLVMLNHNKKLGKSQFLKYTLNVKHFFKNWGA